MAFCSKCLETPDLANLTLRFRLLSCLRLAVLRGCKLVTVGKLNLIFNSLIVHDNLVFFIIIWRYVACSYILYSAHFVFISFQLRFQLSYSNCSVRSDWNRFSLFCACVVVVFEGQMLMP